ncbi:MAG TPA: DUF4190 domain-containing protein [Trebonia sp.]|nr:DUF4190 domain-containing protein [Trebonia sp.]
MGYRLNPPPGWPPVPRDFVPPPGWQPDPSWPPVPPGWPLWVEDGTLPAMPAAYPGVSYSTVGMPKTGTNGWAIASFVLGLISISVLSIIFGIIALTRIHNTPQRGKGLAIAGLCLSGVWIAGVIGFVAYYASTAAQRSSTGQITQSGHLHITQLHAGDCFQNDAGNQPSAGATNQITAVTCGTPHNAQVIALLPVSGSAYPGAAAFKAQADPGCEAKAKADVNPAQITPSMNLLWYYPEPEAWTEGQHSITCVVADSSKDLTSSLLK